MNRPALRSSWLVGCSLAAAVLAAFSPVLQNGFVGYDDPDYVTRNPFVQRGLTAEGLAWAFRAVYASNWHPLTWASHMLDVTLFGLDPAGHHLTSVLLHAANTVLLFLLLRRDTGRFGASVFVAAVFGLHPLHVESVAWVAERKDVLSGFFWLAAMYAYGSYVRRPTASRYALVMGLFGAGLMAKPMVVTLPVILLLWDGWPLKRYPGVSMRRLLLEKVPLVALAGLSAAITIHAQEVGDSLVAMERLPLGTRIANATVSYVQYVGKTLWPSDLAAFYPYPSNGVPGWQVGISLGLLVGTGILSVWFRRQRGWGLVGWGWHVVALAPVIGLLQVGLQSMADRYMYVPMVGLLIVIAWAAEEAAARSRNVARMVSVVAAVVLAAFGVLTWHQGHVWRDGVTLWTHALDVTDGNFIAHNNLGVELDERGRNDEALGHYREALRIRPGDRNASGNYAMALFAKGEQKYGQGDLSGALALFEEGLLYRPDNDAAREYVRAIETVKTGTPNRSR